MCDTALQDALGIDVPLWEWMAKKVPIDQIQCDGPGYPSVPDVSNCVLTPDEKGLVFRPELNNFALAMAGGGKASGAAHAFGGSAFCSFRIKERILMRNPSDYPWADLGNGLVVDVGGGVGTSLNHLPINKRS